MKISESRKSMIARHTQEIERAVDSHKARMVSMMNRQRLELIELMMLEDTRQKPHDVIALMKVPLLEGMKFENPQSAEYCDCADLVRALDRFAQKFPSQEDE